MLSKIHLNKKTVKRNYLEYVIFCLCLNEIPLAAAKKFELENVYPNI